MEQTNFALTTQTEATSLEPTSSAIRALTQEEMTLVGGGIVDVGDYPLPPRG